MTVDHGKNAHLQPQQLVKPGDSMVLVKITNPDGQAIWQLIDRYRLDSVGMIIIGFFVLVVGLSRWRGFGSIIGMLLSLYVIVQFIVPMILSGRDPLLISIAGSVLIMISTMYLAHGFSRQTTMALGATFLTLVITGVLAVAFVGLTHLTGMGSEDAYTLTYGPTEVINFKGLLIGGMIIGALGVLDDVTTGLTATIFELKKANSKLQFRELVKSGLNVGREHVASLVNTLVLAYAGAGLPIVLLLVLNPNHYPLWAVLNSEMMMEEVVRTLAGSIGLLLAVPITTVLTAYMVVEREAVKLDR